MAKRHRLITKALKTLGWKWDDKSQPLDSIKDIDHIIWENKDTLNKIEELRARMDDTEKDCHENIQQMEALKNQIEIEEYKELNPGKNIFKI